MPSSSNTSSLSSHNSHIQWPSRLCLKPRRQGLAAMICASQPLLADSWGEKILWLLRWQWPCSCRGEAKKEMFFHSRSGRGNLTNRCRIAEGQRLDERGKGEKCLTWKNLDKLDPQEGELSTDLSQQVSGWKNRGDGAWSDGSVCSQSQPLRSCLAST